jgi:hypothetical protein
MFWCLEGIMKDLDLHQSCNFLIAKWLLKILIGQNNLEKLTWPFCSLVILFLCLHSLKNYDLHFEVHEFLKLHCTPKQINKKH